MKINLDEGYQFGLGAFETIRVDGGVPKLLKRHIQRLNHTLEYLDISNRITEGQVQRWLEEKGLKQGALKVMASRENTVITSRANPYGPRQWELGFQMDYSPIRRNETSPLVYHKTFHYGDCLLEKRRAAKEGMDERIFLNGRGELCEGTCTNLFFASGDQVYTPKLSCGLLPGVVRSVLLELGLARETVLRKEDVKNMDECFVTNSLMEIMPVRRLGDVMFSGRAQAEKCLTVFRSCQV